MESSEGIIGRESSRDRERTRTNNNGPTQRPTLGAVGRVASKVRTNGIRRMSSTFLPRVGKDESDDDDVISSPWGQTCSQLLEIDNNREKSKSEQERVKQISTNLKQKLDIVDLASPLSSISNPPSNTNAEGKNSLSENRDRDRDVPRKQNANGRGERDVMRGLVRSLSKLGIRGDTRSKQNEKGLRKSSSSFAIGQSRNNGRPGHLGPVITKELSRKIFSAIRETKGNHKPNSEILDDVDDELSSEEQFFDMREMCNKDKASIVKGNKEKKKGILNVSRTNTGKGRGNFTPKASMSMLPIGEIHPNEDYNSGEEPNSNKSNPERKKVVKEGKGLRNSWIVSHSKDDMEEKGKRNGGGGRLLDIRKRTSSVFLDRILGINGELGDGKKLESPRHRLRSPKNKGRTALVEEEGFNSEEDEFVAEVPPRSLLMDDFITYQTNNNRKGNNRNKIRNNQSRSLQNQ